MMEYASEAVSNLHTYAHTPYVVLHSDGRLYLDFQCASYEGAEDTRIALAIRDASGGWHKSTFIVDRFLHEGDWWVPEHGPLMVTPKDELWAYFWACPLAGYEIKQKITTRRMANYLQSRLFRARITQGEAESPAMLFEDRTLLFQAPPVKLHNGKWMIPVEERVGVAAEVHASFLVSDENQEHWQTVGDIYAPPGCSEPHVVELPGGEILCYLRYGASGGHVWRSRSQDEGRTWSPPELTNLRNPGSPVALGLSAQSGRLMIAYNDSYRLRTPLCIGLSEDYGKTWHVRDIESGPGEYSYPQLVQTADGQWHIFYCRNLQLIQHGWFDEEWLENGREVVGVRS